MAIILTLRLMMLTVKLAAIQFSEDEGEHSVTSHIHFAAVQENCGFLPKLQQGTHDCPTNEVFLEEQSCKINCDSGNTTDLVCVCSATSGFIKIFMGCRWVIGEECPSLNVSLEPSTTSSPAPTTLLTSPLTQMDKRVDVSMISKFGKTDSIPHNVYSNMLTANEALMRSLLNEASRRNNADTLAKLTRELPVGTTCPNMAWSIGCLMQTSLDSTVYNSGAMTPSEIMDWLYETGVLFPSGPGDQSVLHMPEASKALEMPVVATAIHSNVAITRGTICSPNDLNLYLDIDLNDIQTLFRWKVTAQHFLQLHKPTVLTVDMSKQLTVEAAGQLLRPQSTLLIPNSKQYFDANSHFSHVTSKSQFISAYREFIKHADCLMIFSEDLPIWPACNALDNGQFGRKMVQLKSEMKMSTGHELEKRSDMPVSEAKFLTNIYENIIGQRYFNAIPNFDAPALVDIPKQCFVICYSTASKTTIQLPVKLLMREECYSKYGKERCNEEYFGKFDTELFEKTTAAPLLCAENGSISYRGMISKIESPKYTGYYSFSIGDNNLLAMASWERDEHSLNKFRPHKVLLKHDLLSNTDQIK